MPQFSNLEGLASIRGKLNAAIDKIDGISPISLNKGTAVSPGAAFSGDSNTGIFSPADDTLGVVTNGTERLRVHPSGGVSVGNTIDPGAGNVRATGVTASSVTTSSVTVSSAAVMAGTVTLNGQVGAGGANYGGVGQVLTSQGAGQAPTWTDSFPSGGIIMWSGSIVSIPSGWLLCDGTNGTPDLRNRFVVGAGSTYAVGATGGSDSVTLSEVNLPAHSHTFSGTTSTDGAHSHAISGSTFDNGDPGSLSLTAGGGYWGDTATGNAGSHAHSFSGTTSSVGSGTAVENRPPYFALAYIMKA